MLVLMKAIISSWPKTKSYAVPLQPHAIFFDMNRILTLNRNQQPNEYEVMLACFVKSIEHLKSTQLMRKYVQHPELIMHFLLF